jgi:hypothetical protein
VPLTFVVSTGRCGSTMLSRALHSHPEVLNVSEFFAMLKAGILKQDFPVREMDGRELWGMLSAVNPCDDAMVRDGLGTSEMVYPYGSGQFELASGVPQICHTTLPMLTDDPDALFGRLAAEVPSWPRRPAAGQYREFFCLLAELMGRRVVVERSGTSLTLVPLLARQFPDARFVHLYRDGPDCALSMSRHPVFRLAGLSAEAARAAGFPPSLPWEEADAGVQRMRELGQVPLAFKGLVTWPFDAGRFMAYELPLAFFGGLWSAMVCSGLPELDRLPPGRWMSLKYEDLLDDPGRELSRLAGFLDVEATPHWLAAAGRLVDQTQKGKAAGLAPGAQASLRAACEPGIQALAAVVPGAHVREGTLR